MCTLQHKHDNSLFSNIFGFLRLPLVFNPYDECSDWVITGVPFDLATSGRSGSRFGPMAIRHASVNLVWERCRWPWNFNIQEKFKIVDCGDLVYKLGSISNFTKTLQNHTENLLNTGKKLLFLGGDHYITLPILRAYSKFYDQMAILHFDAHADYYHNDSKYDHGSIILNALTEELFDPYHSIQIGIRTEYSKNFGFTVLDADYVNRTDVNVVVDQIITIIQNFPVYLTFDIDCLDPSVAPGTGTPVIGGLTTFCVLQLIRGLKKLNIIGIDLVEVSPIYDCAQITSLAAATLGLEMLYAQVKT